MLSENSISNKELAHHENTPIILTHLRPTFIHVKLGYIIFFSSAQSIDCVYSLELPPEAVITSTHNLCLVQEYEKYPIFFIGNISFFWL